jgi:hypothetical protein
VSEVELGAKAFCAIAAIGLVSGFASAWAFRRFSNALTLRRSLNGIVAHLFELQLFSAEPALVIRAQRDLLAANGRFLLAAARPSLVLLLPFALVFIGMHAVFGHAPLQVGRPTVVTLSCEPGETRRGTVELNAPPGIQVETTPLNVPRLGEISWRVRPSAAAKGSLDVRCDGRVIRKTISSSPALQWLSTRRAGSLGGFLLQPFELPFLDRCASGISVEYPRATILNHSWMLWFCMAICAGALGFAVVQRCM